MWGGAVARDMMTGAAACSLYSEAGEAVGSCLSHTFSHTTGIRYQNRGFRGLRA